MRLKPQAHFFYFFIVIYKFKTLSIVHYVYDFRIFTLQTPIKM